MARRTDESRAGGGARGPEDPYVRRRPPAGPDLPAIAERFRLLAQPVRLAILLALDGREPNVTQMCVSLAEGQPAVSTRLHLLRASGLVEPRRAGKNVYYSLTEAGRAAVEGVRMVAGAIG